MEQPPAITIPSDDLPFTIRSFKATSFTLACGEGQVIISLETGKVTLTGCTADEGAKAFWDAIERMYPRR